MYATEVFARYATEFRQARLDDEVLHHAKRAVIDWHAALFPGLEVAPMPQLRALLRSSTARLRMPQR